MECPPRFVFGKSPCRISLSEVTRTIKLSYLANQKAHREFKDSFEIVGIWATIFTDGIFPRNVVFFGESVFTVQKMTVQKYYSVRSLVFDLWLSLFWGQYCPPTKHDRVKSIHVMNSTMYGLQCLLNPLRPNRSFSNGKLCRFFTALRLNQSCWKL